MLRLRGWIGEAVSFQQVLVGWIPLRCSASGRSKVEAHHMAVDLAGVEARRRELRVVRRIREALRFGGEARKPGVASALLAGSVEVRAGVKLDAWLGGGEPHSAARGRICGGEAGAEPVCTEVG